MLQVKRELKRAKLFRIQKITKRIKQLERKKGTEVQLQKNRRKTKRLVDELELIKELNLNDLASEVLQAYAEGTFAVNSKLATHGGDSQARVKWQLLSSKQLQQGLSRLKHKEKTALPLVPPAGSVVLPSQSDTSSIAGSDASVVRDPISDSEDSTAIREITLEEEDSSDHGLELSGTTAAITELHHGNVQVVSMKSVSAIGDKDRVRKTRRKSKLVPEKAMKKEDSDEECIGVPRIDGDKNRSRAMKLDSMFLESLGSSSKSGGTKAQKKKKKNRLGQRTRKREWEKLYRAKAKHLQQRKQQSDRVILTSAKSSKANSKGSVTSSSSSRSSIHHFQATTTPGEELHPSWAASRKKKAQERGIQEFQGQKIVFSDSD